MQPTTFIIILFEGYRPLKQLHHLQYGVSPSNEFFVCRLYQDKAFCHDTGGASFGDVFFCVIVSDY